MARALVSLLKQGMRRVADYATEFCTLAAEGAPIGLPSDLDSLIALAIKINKCLSDGE